MPSLEAHLINELKSKLRLDSLSLKQSSGSALNEPSSKLS